MVEGRVFFGSLVSSVAVVILVVILGLRYLNGTLGGSYAAGSLLLSIVFLAVITVVLILSMTDWVEIGGLTANGISAAGHASFARSRPHYLRNVSPKDRSFYNSAGASFA